ncbi:hypothetical protein [Fictibacillus gelatini]|uniref:hypothetical protein n=1 Tax=Fictibacillus gelatini TaxID=225985 RepID=UPI0004283DF0|nr:hypothetical protein [Fictibacillus gelatini]
MERQLKDLPHLLNEGELKHVTFTEEGRRNVFRKIHRMNARKKPSFFSKFLHQGLTFIVCGLLLFFILQVAGGKVEEKRDGKERTKENQVRAIPYVNLAILTSVQKQMMAGKKVNDLYGYQSGETLNIAFVFAKHVSKQEKHKIAETVLKKISHLMLDEPYNKQNGLGGLWNKLHVTIQVGISDDSIDYPYHWPYFKTEGVKMTWDKKIRWGSFDEEDVEQGVKKSGSKY